MDIRIAEHNAQDCRVEGYLGDRSFRVDNLRWSGAELTASMTCELDEAGLTLTFHLGNTSAKPARVGELSFDYTIDAQGEGKSIYTSLATTPGEWTVSQAENCFVCTGFEQGGICAVLMPVFRAQFIDVCELDAAPTRRMFRAYFRADEHRQELRTSGQLLRQPSMPLFVASNATVDLKVRLFAAESLDEVRTALRHNGMLADAIAPGINAATAPRTDFFSAAPDVSSAHILADSTYCAKFEGGRLTALTRTQGSVEFINPARGFGDIELVLGGGRTIATAALPQREQGIGRAVCESHGLRIERTCAIESGLLVYRFAIENCTNQSQRVTDLRMTFPMNSRMDWGVSAAERVLRHSQVAQDNSFFLFTPCDGKPPYLLCLPLPGTSFEFFDLNEQREYRAYLHAEGAEVTAREAGCEWRQPVSALTLEPGKRIEYGLSMQFVDSYRQARERTYAAGLCDIEVVPGLTVPRGQKVILRAKCAGGDLRVIPEYKAETRVELLSREGDVYLYALWLERLGENRLTVTFDGKTGIVELFVTLPIEQLIKLRGKFIAGNQVHDESKWYDGLLAEWNNETGAQLTPDDYDKITGWRVYEVTCDDPGLSKPAFLASKNAEYPDECEIDALEYYVDRFVWGGLQRTDEEEYPYALYGIPDWHALRGMGNVNSTELAHLWRGYDYPHIALMYYKLYRIGRADASALRRQPKEVYLERAYRTFLAMFTYPTEIGHNFVGENGLYGTGFYNELTAMDVIESLIEEGRAEAAARLGYHWQKKVSFFINQCKDLFGSEYAFDTTGFETTQAVVNWARQNACTVSYSKGPARAEYGLDDVERFALRQTMSNIACRGNLENAYYLRGSDIRGDSGHYLLSYMSQMGGWSLLEEALYGPGDPFELLRIAYASTLSSWALMNAGDEESGYGYWFPGAEHNGAAGGGFEPAPTGHTWLEQPHHRGSWYYSCEIDLGFCGGLRAANTVLAEDPEFGLICYGGNMESCGDATVVEPADGMRRRFHYIGAKIRMHILVQGARLRRVTLHSSGQVDCLFDDFTTQPSIRIQTNPHTVICLQDGAELVNGWHKIKQGEVLCFRLGEF